MAKGEIAHEELYSRIIPHLYRFSKFLFICSQSCLLHNSGVGGKRLRLELNHLKVDQRFKVNYPLLIDYNIIFPQCKNAFVICYLVIVIIFPSD